MSNLINLALWKSVSKTDPKYTKEFNRGGGFKGTSINATYQVRKATDAFGPIGIGWGYEILDESIIEGHQLSERGERHKIHRIKLKLWYGYKVGDQIEKGEVVHFGQTTLVGSNKYGIYTDEEAPKKSLTDALSKCLSMLGFSADVFLGLYDDNKYVNDLRKEFKENPEAPEKKADKEGHWLEGKEKIWWTAVKDKLGLDKEEVHKILGVNSVFEFAGTKEDAWQILKDAANVKNPEALFDDLKKRIEDAKTNTGYRGQVALDVQNNKDFLGLRRWSELDDLMQVAWPGWEVPEPVAQHMFS